MDDTPVCFLYDGVQVPKSLLTTHGTCVLSKHEVRSQLLRDRSFGPGLTKMVALFESPFETFLYLDADTTVCGDLRKLADFDNWDLIVDQREHYDEEAINQWFFDTSKIGRVCPDFDWQSHAADYFCTGTFFARRDALSLSRYIELLNAMESDPGVFKFWEMGLLNVMIFESMDRGHCRVRGVPYQLVTRDHPTAELKQTFSNALAGSQSSDAFVFHYPVTKPHLRQTGSFTSPMSFFRREHLRSQGVSSWMQERKLYMEDWQFYYRPYLRRQIRDWVSSFVRAIGVHRILKQILTHRVVH